MISYDKVKENATLLIALTSLTSSEFEKLLVTFEKAWEDYIIKNHIDKKERHRQYGGGRKPVLLKIEDKLLFILIYLKLYPLQILIGFLFGMSQSQANEWIHKLSSVLKMALDSLSVLPERDSHNLKEALEKDGEKEVAIDGTERRRQRPKDNEKQKEYYKW
jgi:hypothetical protein